MASGELLYDDVAMNNALSLIASADTKLIVAKKDYSSMELIGETLTNDAETIIDEVGKAFSDAASALSGIDTSINSKNGNGLNITNR